MSQQKQDPIQAAMAACNTGAGHREMVRLQNLFWESHHGEIKRKEFWDSKWHSVADRMRRRFKSHFKAPCWSQLWIEWLGKGYAVNHSSVTTQAYLHYRLMWKGMVFEREFAPQTMADVDTEARKLKAVMQVWEDMQ